MKTIWKFPLRITDEQAIAMPAGAALLAVAMQGGTLCLWAMVDPSATVHSQRIRIVGTGHPIDFDADFMHIGTAHDSVLGLVWHVLAEVPE